MSVAFWLQLLAFAVTGACVYDSIRMRGERKRAAFTAEIADTELRRLRDRLAESESILRYYASPELWKPESPQKRSPAMRDRGKVAREAVKRASGHD